MEAENLPMYSASRTSSSITPYGCWVPMAFNFEVYTVALPSTCACSVAVVHQYESTNNERAHFRLKTISNENPKSQFSQEINSRF
jgi:hypothetical protein